jgi:H+-translocating NAD(P) transhydrogenase subunit alpha
MRIFIPRETKINETRIPLVPNSVEKLKSLGAEITVETGLGSAIHISDEEYRKKGAEIATDKRTALANADLVLRLNPPPVEDVACMRQNAIHISFMNPFQSDELVEAFRSAGVSALSMEMIPRSTIAQKMDALSSQASLAGYVAVITAAQHLDKIFPMMVTPSGTIQAARVFIIGAGVAGLQAIATAKRLGARVQAFDTRPAVAEQVQSLGAKFVKIDLGETSQTDQGYAKELTDEQLEMQRQAMAKICAQSDIVITTAQLFGKRAPLIVTQEMIDQMLPGSLLVDLAVESGGNVAGSQSDMIIGRNGVKIIGLSNFPGQVAYNASEMYSSNLLNFIGHFWQKETCSFDLNFEDEIIAKSLITHRGEVVNPLLKQLQPA